MEGYSGENVGTIPTFGATLRPSFSGSDDRAAEGRQEQEVDGKREAISEGVGE